MKTLLCLALLVVAPPALAQGASYQALGELRKTVSKPTLTEAYGNDPLETGDLRLPAGKGPFPIAVVIHGGCWTTIEDRSGTAPLADALAQRGIATWNIDYRRQGDPGGGYPGTLADIAAGVDHVRDLAKRYPLDLKRVAVIGHSSGAHLALWAASRPKLHDPIAGKDPLAIATVVPIDGPGALAPFIGVDAEVCGSPAIAPFMGGTPAEKPKEYALATPQNYLPLGVHQLLVFGALGEWMQPYAEAAMKSGDEVTKLAPGGADHFNILTPTLPQGKEVINFIATQAFAE